jgi:hypothetical protein
MSGQVLGLHGTVHLPAPRSVVVSAYQLVTAELESAPRGLTAGDITRRLALRGAGVSESAVRVALRAGVSCGAFSCTDDRPATYRYVPPAYRRPALHT